MSIEEQVKAIAQEAARKVWTRATELPITYMEEQDGTSWHVYYCTPDRDEDDVIVEQRGQELRAYAGLSPVIRTIEAEEEQPQAEDDGYRPGARYIRKSFWDTALNND